MMTCYEIIYFTLQMLGFIILAIMVYSIKAKERAEKEESKRAEDYAFAKWRYESMERAYRHEAEEYSRWLHFAVKYGCRTPEEMRALIDDLIGQINKLEAK